MRFLAILFFVIVCSQVKAQQLTGQVVDRDGVGVVCAHVFYPETLKGTTTNATGYFSMTQIPKLKNILVSCVGYSDTIIPIETIIGGTIKLRKKEYHLEEVSVIAKRSEEIFIGSKKKPKGITFLLKGDKKDYKGWFLYFPRNSNAKLKSIGLHIRKFNNPNIKLHFRVLAPDALYKTLGTDLLLNDIEEPIKKGWTFIDFTKENIRFTKNGLIVAFYLTGMEKNDEVVISGIANEPEYSWMSSLNYKLDCSLKFGDKKHKPALQMLILE